MHNTGVVRLSTPRWHWWRMTSHTFHPLSPGVSLPWPLVPEGRHLCRLLRIYMVESPCVIHAYMAGIDPNQVKQRPSLSLSSAPRLSSLFRINHVSRLGHLSPFDHEGIRFAHKHVSWVPHTHALSGCNTFKINHCTFCAWYITNIPKS